MLVLSRKHRDGLVIRVYDDSGKLLETIRVKILEARGVVKFGCEGHTERVKFLREEIADDVDTACDPATASSRL